MKALVVYDTAFGNTEKIAQAIGQGLGPADEVRVIRASEATPQQLAGLDLLAVGSATQRFRPLPAASTFLKSIPDGALNGIKVAAFDTRATEEDVQKIRILAFFVKIFGYAAEPIGKRLQKKGGEQIIAPAGFYVGGTEGPLIEGELQRAQEWGSQIRARL
jgi:flavodoxin